MSATITWRPTTTGHEIPLLAPQTFMDKVSEALDTDRADLFSSGQLLTGLDLPALRGLLAGLPEPEADRFGLKAGVKELIKAIQKHGEIYLSVAY